jgi:hypothetical protein
LYRSSWSSPEVEVTPEDADAALLGFITERSLPIMRSVVLGETYEAEMAAGNGAEFLVSSFIANLYERDPSGFSYLETVVKGSMLATALYLPNPGSQGERLTDLQVYVDTPFLLRLLGYEGRAAGAAATELVALLKSLGARVCCFEHTELEVSNVLSSCAAGLRTPRRRDGEAHMPIVEHCLREQLGPSEIDRRVEKLPKDLSSLGVSILATPAYAVETTVDEKELAAVLQDVVHYHREDTRLYDLKSLVAINHLRRGHVPRTLEKARAIFITPNASLVRASRQFFGERPNGDAVPTCALDHEVATVAWLRQPVAAPELPRKQIVADCYAAMYPNEALWRRYLEEVERLRSDETIGEEDYYVLRFSVEARRALMDETLGREEAFTVGTIEDVLRRAHETHQATLLAQLRDARAETDSERRAREDAERRASDAHADADRVRTEADTALSQAEVERAASVTRLAQRLARPIARSAMWLGTILVLVVLLLALPEPFPSLFGEKLGVPSVIFGLLILVVTILAALNLSIGVSVRSLAERLEGSLTRKIERFLRKHL